MITVVDRGLRYQSNLLVIIILINVFSSPLIPLLSFYYNGRVTTPLSKKVKSLRDPMLICNRGLYVPSVSNHDFLLLDFYGDV